MYVQRCKHYSNIPEPFGLEAGEYTVKEIYIDGDLYGNTDTIAKEDVDKLGDKSQITAILG